MKNRDEFDPSLLEEIPLDSNLESPGSEKKIMASFVFELVNLRPFFVLTVN